MKKPELSAHPALVKQCYQDILSINKKKNLLFKVNEILLQLVERTNDAVDAVKKEIGIAG